MSNEKGKLIWEEEDYVNNWWKDGLQGIFLGLVLLFLLPGVLILVGSLLTQQTRSERAIYGDIGVIGIGFLLSLVYLMEKKGPIKIYENGIDYPTFFPPMKYEFILFSEMKGIYLSQSPMAKSKKVPIFKLRRGMTIITNEDHLFFSILQTKKVVPILRELLKNRWDELIRDYQRF